MKLYIKLVIITFLIFIQTFQYTLATNNDILVDRSIVISVSKRIQVFIKDKDIDIHVFEKKIYKLLEKKQVSQRVIEIFHLSFQEIKNSNEPKVYNFSENIFLYPYYRDVYLKKLDTNLISRNIFRLETDEKKIYLTFDDGPHKKSTLNYFKNNSISASFFLICNRINSFNIKEYDSLLFSIWAHTFSHGNYDKMSSKELSQDIEKCKNIFKKNNISFDKFRPAFWIINSKELDILEKYNLKNYIWSMDSLDWDNGFTHKRAELMSEKAQWWDIILFHENVDLNDLDYFIKLLEKGWFSFWKL